MTVSYKGTDANFNYRLAEISFNEDIEQALFNRLAKIMEIKGWEITPVADGYASCKVEDREQYREFVEDYKAVKKSVKLWQKFSM